MLGGQWKRRALEAEAQVQACREAMEGIDLRFRERAALMSITRDGALLRFTFVRHDQLHMIETYGTWSDDVEGWKRALLAPMGGDTDEPT